MRRVTMMTTKVYEVNDETYKKTVAWLLNSMGAAIPTMMVNEWDMGWKTTPGAPVQYDPCNRYYYDTNRKDKLLQGEEEKLVQQEWVPTTIVEGWDKPVAGHGPKVYITKREDMWRGGIYETGPKVCIEIHGGSPNQIYLLVFRDNLKTIKTRTIVKYS